MRTCKLCDNKHHGKGYCKKHYNAIVLKDRVKNIKCSVKDCENTVSINGTKNKLCEKHKTRLKRNGSVDERKRARNVFSILETMKELENPLEFEFCTRTPWANFAKAYYGYACSICGWNDGTCDVHHIIEVKNGGRNTLANAKVLCPNCHRKIHTDKNKTVMFSVETIMEIRNAINSKNKLRAL